MKRPSVRMRRAELARCALFSCFTVAVIGVVSSACGPIDATDAGRELFSNPRLSVSPSNAFACATCHATTENGNEETKFSGYTMRGVSDRPTLWGERYTQLIDAVNFCMTEFMRGEKFDTQNKNGLSLLAYLQSLDGGSTMAQPLSVVQNINDVYLAMLPPGDAGRGQRGYDAACAVCHGDAHSGKGRLGTYVSIIPDDTIKGFGAQARAITIEKIRHGKFFSIGGNMPFYSLEALSDAELSDIVAYLVP